MEQLVNDIHSQLNATRVERILRPRSCEDLQQAIADASRSNKTLCIAGGRHSMGGQQFRSGAIMLDTTRLSRVRGFEPTAGTIEVEAGIQWPELAEFLLRSQRGKDLQWGIAQKQTGADRLCLGGAISSNVHGRGLSMKPIIGDIESFELIDADGIRKTCSRAENEDLFSLVIGGYGLFGVVYSLRLRLTPRVKMERVVEVITADTLHEAFERRIQDGFLYGDFQYAIDERSDDFLWKGVLSCYRPVDSDTKMPGRQKEISRRIWHELVYMAHVEKSKAFNLYAEYYLSTSGQIYWSDTLQLGGYLEDYHRKLDRRMRAPHKCTEMITEIFVPRDRLADFLTDAREDLRRNAVNVIYGTIRLIERDDESFLAWATQPYACVIFNLHTEHTPRGIEHSADAFRRLIDMAIRRGGRYFLTYHRFAGRDQVEECYPQFREFLKLKCEHDPMELFQSDWYVDYKRQFAG